MLGVTLAEGRVSESLPHCFCYIALLGPFLGTHCYMEAERGEPTPPASSVAQMLQLFSVVIKCPDPA